jgi:hypothetical protein
MGQLLVIMIVPPLVGLATYAVIRLLWKTHDQAEMRVRQHQLDGKFGG